MDLLDIKFFPSRRTGYTLPPGLYEICDSIKMLEFLSPVFVEVSITIIDIRLRSNLNINQSLIFAKNFFSIHNWDLSNLIWDP